MWPLAVLTRWPHLRGFFMLRKMYGRFVSGQNKGGRNKEVPSYFLMRQPKTRFPAKARLHFITEQLL